MQARSSLHPDLDDDGGEHGAGEEQGEEVDRRAHRLDGLAPATPSLPSGTSPLVSGALSTAGAKLSSISR